MFSCLFFCKEFLLHERLMFEQKEGLRAAGEEWPRHHMQPDKPVGLGVMHYPQPLQQQHMESSKVCSFIFL